MAPSTPAATAPGTRQRPGWWPLAVIASAHLMAVLDTTVMFVALPSIQHGLHMTVASRQWVVTTYTLALAGLLLPGGRLADRFGARSTLIVGVAGFAVTSAVGGAAETGDMLIAARAVQGAFAAVLVSSTKSLLVTVYRDDQDRTRALGIFTATLTAGLGAGLVLGGVITAPSAGAGASTSTWSSRPSSSWARPGGPVRHRPAAGPETPLTPVTPFA